MTKACSARKDWITLGDSNIKVEKLYEGLNLQLKDVMFFSTCPYSGPIAICWSHGSCSFKISIYNCSGRLYSSQEVSDVILMEWSREQRLVVVTSKGGVDLFSPLGERTSQFHIVKDVYITSSILFGGGRHSGVAILDGHHRLTVANNVNNNVCWNVHLPQPNPTAWTVMQANCQLTNVITVHGCTFYKAVQGEKLKVTDTPWSLTDGQYVSISSDWPNEKIALYHSSEVIHVCTSDLSSLHISIAIPHSTRPFHSLGWFSPTFLYVYRKPTGLQLLSTQDEGFPCKELCFQNVCIGSEMDGLKVFTDDRYSFVSAVTKEEEAVLGIVSNADGSLLHDASQQLGDVKGGRTPYEYITAVSDIPRAISECIDAAKCTREPKMQKSLLKAARLGMAFTTHSDCDSFVSLLHLLRIMNEVGRRKTAIPITYAQLKELSFPSLRDRLIDIDAYPLAIKFCNSMSKDGHDEDIVVLAWLKKLIMRGKEKKYSMSELDELIASRLALFPHVSFADAVDKALEVGMKELARKLIAREKNDERQVECLLRLGDVGEAIARAGTLQQPALIHLVLRHLSRTLSKSELELQLSKIPHAQCVYQDYMRQHNNDKQMLALLTQNSDMERLLIYHMDAVVACTGPFESEQRESSMTDATKVASQLRENSLVEVLTEACSLTVPSREGEKSLTSITCTRDALMASVADPESVARMAKMGKLTEKQVHQWTIEGLAKAKRWVHLGELSKKKSPIGYAPFVKACVANGRKDEGEKYLAKATVYADQVEALLALRHFTRAAKAAYDRKDVEMLNRIHTMSFVNKEANAKIGEMAMSLGRS